MLMPGRLSKVPMTGIRRKKLMAIGKNPLEKNRIIQFGKCRCNIEILISNHDNVLMIVDNV